MSTAFKNHVIILAIVFHITCMLAQGQTIDSLLNNKRVYHTLNIGDLPPPRIDGELNDEIWSLGEWQGDFTQQQPAGGEKGTENTYVKVLYDFSNLYVAIISHDSEPEKIREIFDRRDKLQGEMAGIAIDSYFDKRTAFEFNLSAAGQKMDVKHLGDYQFDYNWDAVWDGATSRNDTGWVAEMKVPFSQMRYTLQDKHVWGMHVWRWISRRHEEDQWQWIPREAPAMVYLFGELDGVENIRSSRQVEILPYILSSVEKYAENEGFDPIGLNAGIDAKVGISSDYTLDLSINPDFGQVEADPSVLNLTSFETFYDEKRPFFLEGNEIFDFTLDNDLLYYSRRIGSAPQTQGLSGIYNDLEVSDRTTILGAAKFTGKNSNGLSVGLVNGLTAEEFGGYIDNAGEEKEIQVAPLSNYLSSRMKREFNEGNTIVGGIFNMVNRISPDSAVQKLIPASAVSGGIDLLHYWDNKNYYFQAKSIASQLLGSSEAILRQQLSNTHRFQRPDAEYLEVDSLKEKLSGHGGLVQFGKNGGNINFNLLGQYRSPGLNLNDIGYIRQADYAGEKVDFTYQMNDPKNWVRNYSIGFSQEARWNLGGDNIMNKIGGKFSMMNNKLWRYYLNYSGNFTHLDTRELRGGPAIRIDGEHMVGATISSNSARDFSGRLSEHYMYLGASGSYRNMIQAQLTWLPIRKLKLSAITTIDRRQYHQQYVRTLQGANESLYVVGAIDQNSASFTFRGELFLTPELSLQYYGSPYYSVGKYDDFKRVNNPRDKNISSRLEILDVTHNQPDNTYSFNHNLESWSFMNPDFSFMQFRSNLVFRWEYNLGSTIYLVWAHDRSGWEEVYNPVSDIAGDLFGVKGNHVLMFKLNFWFSV
jgi:hypothetical protein